MPPGTGYRFPKFADETTIDEKGRVTVLARDKDFLRTLPEKELLAVTLNGTVAVVYPAIFYEQFEKQFELWASMNPKHAVTARTLINRYGCEVAVDAGDRLLIPQKLREKVGLTGKHKLCVAWVKGRLELKKLDEFTKPIDDPVAWDEARKSMENSGIF